MTTPFTESIDASKRRLLVGIAAVPAFAASSGMGAAQPQPGLYAYIGCRTTKERNARGKGLSVYRVDRATGEWTLVQLVEGLDNPSFLALDRTNRFLYSVHGDLGDVSAHAIDPASGRLTLLNRRSTGGRNPVHLAADPTNRQLVVANYATGTVVLLPIQADGSLGEVVDMAALPGTPGPHRTQQGSSHPHDVPFDPSGRFVIVPDKGLDRVFAFQVDAAAGKLVPASVPSVASREGAGPRHVAFHPSMSLAYVMNELDSSITTYRFDAQTGRLTPLQIVSTLPSDYTGNNTGAEIAVSRSGRFLFGSNRGHDTVVTMAIDAKTGLLSPQSWTGTAGQGPRFFALDPADETLYAANENSDSIVALRVTAAGALAPTGKTVHTGSPVCIVFLDAGKT
jgi:6-phosphogluconolactonase (cycloisomerase 2 family)